MRKNLIESLLAQTEGRVDEAEKAFHQYVVGRSRQILESLRAGEDLDSIDADSLEENRQSDDTFFVGDVVDHDKLGRLEVIAIVERDIYGKGAEFIVTNEKGKKLRISYDYLVGAIDKEFDEINPSNLTESRQSDDTFFVGDVVDHDELGKLEVVSIVDRDIYGKGAEFIVTDAKGKKRRISYDYLVGAIDKEFGDINPSNLTESKQSDDTFFVGDVVDHDKLGRLKVAAIVERDIYGKGAEFIVTNSRGKKLRISYDYLVGAIDKEYDEVNPSNLVESKQSDDTFFVGDVVNHARLGRLEVIAIVDRDIYGKGAEFIVSNPTRGKKTRISYDYLVGAIDKEYDEVNPSNLVESKQSDDTFFVGDVVDHDRLGRLKVVSIVDRDIYGKGAEFIVTNPTRGKKLRISYDYLVGAIDKEYDEIDPSNLTESKQGSKVFGREQILSKITPIISKMNNIGSEEEYFEFIEARGEHKDVFDKYFTSPDAHHVADRLHYHQKLDNEVGAFLEDLFGGLLESDDLREGKLELSQDDDGKLEITHVAGNEEESLDVLSQDFAVVAEGLASKIMEAYMNELETVKVDLTTDGRETGGSKFKQNKVSPVNADGGAKKGAKPVKVVSDQHAGHDRERGPKFETGKPATNTVKRGFDAFSRVRGKPKNSVLAQAREETKADKTSPLTNPVKK